MKKSTSEKPEQIYVRSCYSLSTNNKHVQEIYVDVETFDGEYYTLVFCPDDYLDTFRPSIFDHVRGEYIKYLLDKK